MFKTKTVEGIAVTVLLGVSGNVDVTTRSARDTVYWIVNDFS
jgi:hypothetical protein